MHAMAATAYAQTRRPTPVAAPAAAPVAAPVAVPSATPATAPAAAAPGPALSVGVPDDGATMPAPAMTEATMADASAEANAPAAEPGPSAPTPHEPGEPQLATAAAVAEDVSSAPPPEAPAVPPVPLFPAYAFAPEVVTEMPVIAMSALAPQPPVHPSMPPPVPDVSQAPAGSPPCPGGWWQVEWRCQETEDPLDGWFFFARCRGARRWGFDA